MTDEWYKEKFEAYKKRKSKEKDADRKRIAYRKKCMERWSE